MNTKNNKFPNYLLSTMNKNIFYYENNNIKRHVILVEDFIESYKS